MINDNQNVPPQPATVDVITEAIENGELPHSDKRYADYYPASDEVCPRCQCIDYQTVQDKGRDMRQCISCGLLYLPLKELCPQCQSAHYLLIKDTTGQAMRQCKQCGQLYIPGARNLPGESNAHYTT